MKWQAKLSKKDHRHLRNMGMTTLAVIKDTLAIQAETRADSENDVSDPCWDCRGIAEKLSLPI